MRAVCPGCTQRNGHLIDPTCPVCTGTGTITLGRRALAFDPPEAVSRAIWIVLEQAAEQALRSPDRGERMATVLPETVARLTRLGLMQSPEEAAL